MFAGDISSAHNDRGLVPPLLATGVDGHNPKELRQVREREANIWNRNFKGTS